MAFISVALTIVGMSYCQVNTGAIIIVGIFGFIFASASVAK